MVEIEEGTGIEINIKITKEDFSKLAKGKKLELAKMHVAGREITFTLQLNS